MEHLDELVLLVDGEIVVLVGREPADVAHDCAQFLLGLLKLLQLARFDLDLVIGIAPEGGSELLAAE